MGKLKRKRLSKSSKVVLVAETPAVYSEDLGTVGVKQLRNGQGASLEGFSLVVNSSEKKRRLERKARFNLTDNNKPTTIDLLYRPLDATRDSRSKAPSESDRLIGENTSLEKPYLRLTDFPRKEDVRPLNVLVKSLAHIKNRYIKDEDFEWANEQLKSVRQDLTVQRLRNPFVLEVYETHARILLEEGDLDEFNQCQTVIRNIVKGAGYDDGCGELPLEEIMGSNAPLSQNEETEDEFRGYGILYALVRNAWSQLKLELAQVNASSLEGREGIELSAVHAIQVVKAVQECDYRTFFRLYECAPHLSAYLMDFLVKRVRDEAYHRVIASHRPTVSIEYIRDALHLADLEETRRFLRQQGASFIQEKGEPTFWIDCKSSLAS